MIVYFLVWDHSIVDEVDNMGVGWRTCNKETGVKFAKMLSQALWYIDAHHDKFCDCSVHILYMYQPDSTHLRVTMTTRKMETKPQLSAESLRFYVDQLSAALSGFG